MKNKPKILTFVGYYLPGYKAGGPLRTIANMVDRLHDDFEFWIVTRDRDLGDDVPYFDVLVNEWNNVGNAQVFYASIDRLSLGGITNIIKGTPCDMMYLNSFFDPLFTLIPLLARRIGRLKDMPVVLAPRGEFSEGAIQLKRLKKSAYIKIAQWLGIYNDIFWHASSAHEVEDIRREFLIKDEMIFIALDLPSTNLSCQFLDNELNKDSNILRVVFLSRISSKKNLDYALRILQKVKRHIVFDIYGPIEDENYWQICLQLCKEMPENITVTYCGSVEPKDIAKTFLSYDLFLFPTRGENYGHVIAESLSIGTPVLLSDQTPWRNLEADGLGWDLALEQMDDFVEVLESYTLKTSDEKSNTRRCICETVIERLINPEVLEANRQLFFKSIQKRRQEINV